MELNGFDHSKPIDIWKEKGKNIIVDGHTRFEITKELGIQEVPVYEHEFKDEDEALQYAIHNQIDRRNLTDAERLKCIELVDKKKKRRGDLKSENFKKSNFGNSKIDSRKETAKNLGISKEKVSEARKVMDDPVEKEKVLTGEKSIHKAYKDIKNKEKTQKNLLLNQF